MSEQHFRSLVDASIDAVITIDVAGRVIGFNPAAERMFGHTQHAAVGRDLAELIIPPRLRARHREGLKRLHETGVPRILDKRLELAAMRVDGTEFPVELTVVKVPGGGDVAYAGYVRDITDRVKAEREYRDLIDHAPVGIYRTTEQGRILSANPSMARLLGAAHADDLIGHSIIEYYADPAERALLLSKVGTGDGANIDFEWQKVDGRPVSVQLDIRAIKGADGTVEYMGFVRDVTERLELEQALHQAQKMDAVGRLAGGIAHDFNNILTAIIGYAEMMGSQMQPDDPHRADAGEIRKAAMRAAELTQQLLAFGRKQLLAPRVLDLADTLRGLEQMLRRLIGPDVSVVSRIAPDLGRIEADPSRVEQVVVNLAVNARDAMPEGGTLTLELANADFEAPAQVGPFTVPAGRWVVLSVGDTGVGMEEPTMAHIFEPFFTTKELGSGTGLGLATVYGVVRQSGGYLAVSSMPGEGSTFRIYLPRVDAPVTRSAPLPAAPGRGAGETIMVVEDEPAVRALLQRALTRAGFTVIAAGDPKAARELSAGHEGNVDLLLTDVVMPGGGGRSLADDLVARRPTLKVIYMSGYTDDVIARQRVRDPGVAFLQKPFSADQATRLIREVLDSAADSG